MPRRGDEALTVRRTYILRAGVRVSPPFLSGSRILLWVDKSRGCRFLVDRCRPGGDTVLTGDVCPASDRGTFG
jgi:hypothetical protein